MARTGQTVEGPFTRIRFVETAADTRGERLVMEQLIRPGGASTPAHRHPRQTERFEVLGGAMTFALEGRTRVLGPGERVDVPRGAAHTFANAGGGDLVVRVTLEPAGSSEAFFETVVVLERSGLLPEKRVTVPQLLQMALLLHHYDLRLAGVPVWVQRPLFGLLSRVARLAGFRASHSDDLPNPPTGTAPLAPRRR